MKFQFQKEQLRYSCRFFFFFFFWKINLYYILVLGVEKWKIFLIQFFFTKSERMWQRLYYNCWRIHQKIRPLMIRAVIRPPPSHLLHNNNQRRPWKLILDWLITIKRNAAWRYIISYENLFHLCKQVIVVGGDYNTEKHSRRTFIQPNFLASYNSYKHEILRRIKEE